MKMASRDLFQSTNLLFSPKNRIQLEVDSAEFVFSYAVTLVLFHFVQENTVLPLSISNLAFNIGFTRSLILLNCSSLTEIERSFTA